jgi:hypothetical protein
MSCEKHRRDGLKAISRQTGISPGKLEEVFAAAQSKGLITTPVASPTTVSGWQRQAACWQRKKKEEAVRELESLASDISSLDASGDSESVTKMLGKINGEVARAKKAKTVDLPKILTRLHEKIAALDETGEDAEVTAALIMIHRANERINSAGYTGPDTKTVEEKYQGEIAAIHARMSNRPKEARAMAEMLTTPKQRARAKSELAESERE